MWAIPTLFGVSIVVFLLTTLSTDLAGPTESEAAQAPRLALDLEDRARSRFLDLPRFFNSKPQDVKSRTDDCVEHVAAQDSLADLCALRIERMGGAALPFILPKLDGLPPTQRGRVALALGPIGVRMGEVDASRLQDPEAAAAFWQQFWADRAIDFTEPAVRRNAERLAKRGGGERLRSLAYVDTFALPVLMQLMEKTPDRLTIVRLSRVVAQNMGRTPIAEESTLSEARAEFDTLRAWWFVHQSDFVAYEGGAKVAATLTETRYAKWVLGTLTGQLGLSTVDGRPVLGKLWERAPITLALALLALALSAAIAVPLGLLTAKNQGSTFDVIVAVLLVGVYSVPSFWAAEVLGRFFDRTSAAGLVLPVVILAAGSTCVLVRQERATLIEILRTDAVRAARAKGVHGLRLMVRHVLRRGLMPLFALGGLQFPALLGGAFVVEEVFSIQGLGWETLRAVETHDVAWLVAVVMFSATVTTLMLVLSDVALALADPRIRERTQRGTEGA